MHKQAESPGFVKAIAASARQREIQRQLRYNRLRRLPVSGSGLLRQMLPPLLADFAGASAAAMLGCWLIGLLLHAAVGIDSLYTFAALGLVYSSQATHHKYRLARDPGYRVPRCRCPGRQRSDDTETVLRSSASSIAGIPSSLLSSLLYAAALILRATGHMTAIVPLAGAAALVGAYLAYMMVFRIRGLCSTCVTLGALNMLILLDVVL